MSRDLLTAKGWDSECLTVDKLEDRVSRTVASHLIYVGENLKMLSVIAGLAGRARAGFAACCESGLSPVRYARLGLPVPIKLPMLDGRLRSSIPQLISFTERERKTVAQKELLAGMDDLEDVTGLGEGLLDQAGIWQRLLGEEGDLLVDWCETRIVNNLRYRYSPLYYSIEYFKEYPEFQLLCDSELLSQQVSAIERLKSMLEFGLDASGGYGAMFGSLSWAGAMFF